MTWSDITWQPIDGEGMGDFAMLAPSIDILRSALEEAASGAILGPATIASADLAEVEAGALPEGFVASSSFELMGVTRRPVSAALDPSLGSTLGGKALEAATLAGPILEAIDGALEAIIGEGIALGQAGELPTDEPLLLVRLGLADRPGEPAEVALVLAVAAEARVEFSTHLIALRALSETPVPPVATVAPAAAASQGGAASGGSPSTGGNGAASTAARAPEPEPAGPTIRPAQFAEFPPAPPTTSRQSIDLLLGVNLQVTVEIGRTRLPIRDVLGLTSGSIVELDKLAGEKVDVLVNGMHIATGEVVVVDENFGVRITDVVSPDRRLAVGALG